MSISASNDSFSPVMLGCCQDLMSDIFTKFSLHLYNSLTSFVAGNRFHKQASTDLSVAALRWYASCSSKPFDKTKDSECE